MKSNKLLAVVCLAVAASSAAAFTSGAGVGLPTLLGIARDVRAAGPGEAQKEKAALTVRASSGDGAQPVALQTQVLPQHRLFRHVFRHLMQLEREAQEAAKRGEAKSELRNFYKIRASLTEAQAAALARTAAEADAEVEAIEKRAQEVIKAARAKYPNGRVEQGQPLPTPPAELKSLQAQRDAALQRAVAKVRRAFGEEAFARFDAFVAREMGPAVSVPVLPVAPLTPEQRRRPRLLPPTYQR